MFNILLLRIEKVSSWDDVFRMRWDAILSRGIEWESTVANWMVWDEMVGSNKGYTLEGLLASL